VAAHARAQTAPSRERVSAGREGKPADAGARHASGVPAARL